MQALCQIFSNCTYSQGMRTGRPTSKPRTPFGRNLHVFREQAGLTQAQVAEQLGISPRAYAFWEREPVALRPEQILKVAEILKVSVAELIGQQDNKKRGKGPKGKMMRLFEAASHLPRSKQEKIIAILEPFVRTHSDTIQ
jgi:transcriptional regulator with XRE-family HTH domain